MPRHASDLLPVADARRRVLDLVRTVEPPVRLPLRDALGRVLAAPVVALMAVPPYASSAMDGYAARSTDLSTTDEPKTFRIVGRSLAGAPFTGRIAAGECIRILTGAVVPADADTVVMQEVVERLGDDAVRIPAGARQGDNVRPAGQDVQRGATVAEPGVRLTPAHLGVIASIGVGAVAVHRRPTVAYFSTGDELRAVGEPLGPGQIYDSNRYALFGLLARLGVDGLDLGVVRDRREDVRRALEQAAAGADAVVTTGGVSVGDTDYVKETVEAIGRVDFWRIAMKPGKPLAVGRIGNALFFGLPGNPVSAMVAFCQFVIPALRRLGGERQVDPTTIEARAAARIAKQPGRLEFQRGSLSVDAAGRLTVVPAGGQDSHLLTSMARADCFIELPLESADVEAGATVRVQPFFGLLG